MRIFFYFYRLFFVLFVGFSSFVFLISEAQAISIFPSLIEASAPAETPYQGLFQIYNEKEYPVSVKVDLAPWATSQTIDPRSWISFGDTTITIGPLEKAAFPFRATLPQGVKGEQIAMFFFSEVPENSGGDQGISIQTRFGSAFYLTSQGTEDCSMVIQNLRMVFPPKDIPGSDSTPPTLFVEISNQGNIHIRPRIELRVTNRQGQAKQLEALYGLPIFPGKTQEFAIQWPDYALWIGRGVAEVKVYVINGGRWGVERLFNLDPQDRQCVITSKEK